MYHRNNGSHNIPHSTCKTLRSGGTPNASNLGRWTTKRVSNREGEPSCAPSSLEADVRTYIKCDTYSVQHPSRICKPRDVRQCAAESRCCMYQWLPHHWDLAVLPTPHPFSTRPPRLGELNTQQTILAAKASRAAIWRKVGVRRVLMLSEMK